MSARFSSKEKTESVSKMFKITRPTEFDDMIKETVEFLKKFVGFKNTAEDETQVSFPEDRGPMYNASTEQAEQDDDRNAEKIGIEKKKKENIAESGVLNLARKKNNLKIPSHFDTDLGLKYTGNLSSYFETFKDKLKLLNANSVVKNGAILFSKAANEAKISTAFVIKSAKQAKESVVLYVNKSGIFATDVLENLLDKFTYFLPAEDWLKDDEKPQHKSLMFRHIESGGCWNGYHRVRGSHRYAKGSCAKN